MSVSEASAVLEGINRIMLCRRGIHWCSGSGAVPGVGGFLKLQCLYCGEKIVSRHSNHVDGLLSSASTPQAGCFTVPTYRYDGIIYHVPETRWPSCRRGSDVHAPMGKSFCS